MTRGARETASNKRLDLIQPSQQQLLLNPLWEQDKMTLSKKYAPLGALALILVEYSYTALLLHSYKMEI